MFSCGLLVSELLDVKRSKANNFSIFMCAHTLNFVNKNPIFFIEFYECNVKSMCFVCVCVCWTIQALWSQFYAMHNWKKKNQTAFKHTFICFVDKMECLILSMWRDTHTGQTHDNIIVFYSSHNDFSHSIEIEPYQICDFFVLNIRWAIGIPVHL